jgi:predicted lipoprotein with Yx(FWY)xxD motif
MKTSIIALLALAGSLAGCGGGAGGGGRTYTVPPVNSPVPVGTAAPGATPASLAQLLGAQGWTSPNGRTLYVFAADRANVSNCNGACTLLWPPFAAAASATATGAFAVITRADGTHQWVYKTHPLYAYAGDSKTGDTFGNGLNSFGGIWSVARP